MTDKNHDKDKAPPPPAAARPAAAQPTLTGSLPPEDYMTEQEKAGLAEADKAKKKETR